MFENFDKPTKRGKIISFLLIFVFLPLVAYGSWKWAENIETHRPITEKVVSLLINQEEIEIYQLNERQSILKMPINVDEGGKLIFPLTALPTGEKILIQFHIPVPTKN